MRFRTLHDALAGSDGPGRRALPVGEFLHPATLAAVVALVVNDHVLKPASWAPGALTGKLSDAAGLLFFPLLATSCLNLLLLALARLGAPVDFTLRRPKLVLAIGATATAFAAVKLSETMAGLAAGAISSVGPPSAIVADATDLWTLPALLLSYAIGLGEIARVPRGRLEMIERLRRRGSRTPVWHNLRDVADAGADRDAVEELASGFEDYLASGEDTRSGRALRRLRGA